MQRKVHTSGEQHHKHPHQPTPITNNPQYLQPPGWRGKGEQVGMMEKPPQYYKPPSHNPTSLQPAKTGAGSQNLAKSMILSQEGGPTVQVNKVKGTQEQAFLPSALRSKNSSYQSASQSSEGWGNGMKRSGIVGPVSRPPTSMSAYEGVNTLQVPSTHAGLSAVNKSGSQENSSPNQLTVNHLIKPEKKKMFESMIIEPRKQQSKTESLSCFNKQTNKEAASTIPSDQPNPSVKIRRPTIWPINVTPLEKKTCADELTFRKEADELVEECNLKIRVFQEKNRMSAPLPKKTEWKMDDFETVEKIGKGAYGDVFLVREKKTNFLCVLKTISKQKIKDNNLEEHILRQIKIQMYMEHRHLTSLYGFFHDEKKIYLIMQYLSDGSLSHVYRKKKIPEERVSRIVRQVCDGLYHLHKEDTIHRDIKPENLLLHEDYVKIGDFGCAIFSNTLRKTVVGCLAYISPEQLANGFYDDKIDVWSVGILTFQLLIGKAPFEQDIIKIAQNQQEPKLSQLNFPSNVQLSPEAINFIQSLLKEEPSERLEIRDALKHPFITKYRETESLK